MSNPSSYVIQKCQVCAGTDLESVLFVGYLPPVNQMHPVGARAAEQPAYPAELLHCPHCQLVQISLVVDKSILFPPEYPYTSRTTKILRDNFAELYAETKTLVPLDAKTLIVDVGSNDGTLLSNFKAGGHPVRGIEPTERAAEANELGVPTLMAFFTADSAGKVTREAGKARVVTATNVFAHIDDVHDVVKSIVGMLDDKGVFISESHYLHALLETLQYDTIYHEHLRYYLVRALKYLLESEGLEIFHVKHHSHPRRIRPRLCVAPGRVPGEAVQCLRSSKLEGARPLREQLKAFASEWSTRRSNSIVCSRICARKASASWESVRRLARARSSTTSDSTTPSSMLSSR